MHSEQQSGSMAGQDCSSPATLNFRGPSECTYNTWKSKEAGAYASESAWQPRKSWPNMNYDLHAQNGLLLRVAAEAQVPYFEPIELLVPLVPSADTAVVARS